VEQGWYKISKRWDFFCGTWKENRDLENCFRNMLENNDYEICSRTATWKYAPRIMTKKYAPEL